VSIGADFTAENRHSVESFVSETQQIRDFQPATSGLKVYCGFLQSMPSGRKPSWPAEIGMTPSVVVGHVNRPRSNRLA